MVQDNPDEPNLWQIIKSVLGAMFGVQSGAVRERDFSRGKPWMYIVVGVVFVTLFVLLVYGVVQWVLAESGL